MNEFLTFRKMITPVIIQVLFWIGVVACVIAAIANILKGGGEAFLGLLMLFLGPIAVRIYCEILIILFRINDNLTEIKQNTARQAQ